VNNFTEESYNHCRGLLVKIREATREWENHSNECGQCEKTMLHGYISCSTGQFVIYEAIKRIQELTEGVDVSGQSEIRNNSG
jgi:hypothetical protein